MPYIKFTAPGDFTAAARGPESSITFSGGNLTIRGLTSTACGNPAADRPPAAESSGRSELYEFRMSAQDISMHKICIGCISMSHVRLADGGIEVAVVAPRADGSTDYAIVTFYAGGSYSLKSARAFCGMQAATFTHGTVKQILLGGGMRLMCLEISSIHSGDFREYSAGGAKVTVKHPHEPASSGRLTKSAAANARATGASRAADD